MDGPARRRRNALAGAALAALAIGIAVGASSGGDEEEPPRRPATPNVAVPPAGEPERAERDPLAGLSLRQQVGQVDRPALRGHRAAGVRAAGAARAARRGRDPVRATTSSTPPSCAR